MTATTTRPKRSRPKAVARSRRLHILVATGSYAPDSTGTAPYNTDLCEYLVSRGHRISVVTGLPHYPAWRVPPPYQGKLWLREQRNGVDILRAHIYVPGKRTPFRRILYDTSIGLAAAVRGLLLRDVDLVLAVSPPLQAALAGCLLARLKRAPLLLQLQDILPDLAIALNMLRQPLVIHLAHTLERFVYRRADAILVIAEGFRANLLSKGVADGKLRVLPNWVEASWLRPQAEQNGFRHSQCLADNEFLVFHAGNMGAKQRLTNVMEAAARLRSESGITFYFVGDGDARVALQEYARSRALTNVRFLPLQPRETLPAVLAAADILVLNQSARVVDMVIPTKLLSYMAAARPVVAAVASASETARLIEQAGCGIVVPPEDPDALAAAICRLRADRVLAAQFGERGRRFAEHHFARERILESWENLLLAAVEKHRRRAGLEKPEEHAPPEAES